MVRELHVEDPHEKEVAWETRQELYYELAVEGIPMPDKLHDLHKEQFTFSGELSTAERRNNALWNNYLLNVDVQDERTPRERLNGYFENAKSGQ
jgi:hypothetical protein